MKNTKKILLIITLIMVVSQPTEAATSVYRIKLTKTYKIQKGEKIKLYIKGHKNSKKIKWKSSKKKVASVSKKGVVTGKKGGTTKITATLGKKKYSTEVTVILGERIVYTNDATPNTPTEDRYDFADINPGDITTEDDSKTVYSEWMSRNQLEKVGLTFFYYSNTNTLHISGQAQKDSLTGTCQSYLLKEIPKNPETNTIYGSDLRYIWNGSEFMYNTIDMKTLGLIVN